MRPFRALLLSALSAVALPLHAQAPDNPLLRLRYLEELRAYPFSEIPQGAMQRARQQLVRNWPGILSPDAPLDTNVATAIWSPIGPAPISGGWSGRLSTIAVHPTDSRIIYVGGAQGGVWITTDGGISWVALSDRECSLAMGSIAIDPVNPEIIYAGTGELHYSADSYYGCGVLRSTDGGATWTQLGGSVFDTNTGGARISRVLIDPSTAGTTSSTTVHVASSFGVWTSRDSGLTWTRVLDGAATDMAMHPTNPQILYAALGLPGGSAANGVYRSADGGITWTRLSNGFPTSNVGRIALALAPSAPGVLYAAIQDAFGNGGSDGRLLGIWKTTDEGVNWVKLTATGADCGSQCWYDLVIATDPQNADIVYFGGIALYRSDDGGARFLNILRNIHVDQHAITFDPRDPATVYVGNDGGIYRSTDRGGTWVSLNTNLALTQFYPGVSLHPFDPSVALGGTQDNGTLEYRGQPLWEQVYGGDGGYTAIDHLDPLYTYAETQWQRNSGYSGPRQRVGTGPFNLKTTGIDLSDRALFIPPLIMDPVDPAVLYFGTFRLYRTGNRGDLWTAISPDLSTNNGSVSAIAPARADPATIYVGTSDGNVHVTRDLGATWTLRRNGLPQRAVMDFGIDHTNPAHAIVVLSGFNSGHVFRTTDFGVTWTDISGNLPDVPVNAVLVHPDLGNTIYIGTDLGVFRSNGGMDWTPFTDGLPNVAVFDLAYNPQTGYIVAATHGRGMFSFRPEAASAVIIAQPALHFESLQDTVRLSAAAFDPAGAPLPGVQFTWISLDPSVASVDASGLVRSSGNGETRIIAAFAGAADTTIVTVAQVPVALADLPASLELVTGERRAIPARAVDANGVTVANAPLTWMSTNPATVVVDATGQATALAEGTSIVVATAGTLSDSTYVAVFAPSVTSIAPASVAPATASSAANTRVPLMRLELAVDGVEPVRITRLAFDVTGDDTGAQILLVHDVDSDGTLGPADTLIASTSVTLRPGTPQRATLTPTSFTVPGRSNVSVLAVLQMSGGAPNGARFGMTFLPEETNAIGTRSGVSNRLQQPGAPLAAGPVVATVLGAGQVLTFSENPVRSARVIFNFAERPTVAAVYTLTGRRVIDFTRGITDDARFEWDLRNDEGSLVAPGVYLVIFNIGGTVMRERLIVLRSDGDPPPGDTTVR